MDLNVKHGHQTSQNEDLSIEKWSRNLDLTMKVEDLTGETHGLTKEHLGSRQQKYGLDIGTSKHGHPSDMQTSLAVPSGNPTWQ